MRFAYIRAFHLPIKELYTPHGGRVARLYIKSAFLIYLKAGLLKGLLLNDSQVSLCGCGAFFAPRYFLAVLSPQLHNAIYKNSLIFRSRALVILCAFTYAIVTISHQERATSSDSVALYSTLSPLVIFSWEWERETLHSQIHNSSQLDNLRLNYFLIPPLYHHHPLFSIPRAHTDCRWVRD